MTPLQKFLEIVIDGQAPGECIETIHISKIKFDLKFKIERKKMKYITGERWGRGELMIKYIISDKIKQIP